MKSLSSLWLILSLTVVGAFGQDVQSTQQAVQNQLTAMKAFQQEQQALVQEQNALMAKGASAEDLAAWNKKNASRFQDLADKAKSISLSFPTRVLPVATRNQIPPDASQEMKDFLTTQNDISNKYAQFHNQRVQAGIASAKTRDEWTLFSQQNAAELQALRQQGKTLAQQTAQQQKPVPTAAPLSSNAPSEMQAFAAAQAQLMQEQTQLMNQYRTADPQTRTVAMQQWQKTNAARLEQLQQLADKVSGAEPAPAITNTTATTSKTNHP